MRGPDDDDDPILVRCPVCRRLFQPDKPMNEDLSRYMIRAVLSAECSTGHSRFVEVIED